MRNPEKFESQFGETQEEFKKEDAEQEINVSQIVKDFQEENRSELGDLEMQVNDLKEAQKERKKLGLETSKEELKSSELRLEGEKIYSEKFVGKLNEVLDHEFKSEDGGETIVLKDVINKYLENFSDTNLSEGNKINKQKELIEELATQISKIPHDSWSINFRHAIETNSLNCSNCASLTGLILENVKEKSDLQNVEYASPYGHAMNIVTLANRRALYVDSRNNIVEDLELGENTKIEDKEGFKVYKINQLKGKIGYKIIPALPIKDGILDAYLGNLDSAYPSARGELPDSVKLRSEEEQNKFQKGAQRICREEGLSNKEKIFHLKALKKVFVGELEKYEKSKEFINEGKRWKESVKFFSPLEPLRELIKSNENVRQEIISNRDKIISYFNFETDELDFVNKKVEKKLKDFRKGKSGFKNKNPEDYAEKIKFLAESLKKLKT